MLWTLLFPCGVVTVDTSSQEGHFLSNGLSKYINESTVRVVEAFGKKIHAVPATFGNIFNLQQLVTNF